MAGADGHEGFENDRTRVGERRAPRKSLLRRRQADQERFCEKACGGSDNAHGYRAPHGLAFDRGSAVVRCPSRRFRTEAAAGDLHDIDDAGSVIISSCQRSYELGCAQLESLAERCSMSECHRSPP